MPCTLYAIVSAGSDQPKSGPWPVRITTWKLRERTNATIVLHGYIAAHIPSDRRQPASFAIAPLSGERQFMRYSDTITQTIDGTDLYRADLAGTTVSAAGMEMREDPATHRLTTTGLSAAFSGRGAFVTTSVAWEARPDGGFAKRVTVSPRQDASAPVGAGTAAVEPVIPQNSDGTPRPLPIDLGYLERKLRARRPFAVSFSLDIDATPGDAAHFRHVDVTLQVGATTRRLHPSGPQWCSRFPTSQRVDDLREPFRSHVKAFLRALREGGATCEVHATYRPRKRAWLMHWAWMITRGAGFHDARGEMIPCRIDPRDVPPDAGIGIGWAHYNRDGSYNAAASVEAAERMVERYDIVYAPALRSRHISREAIDVSISWTGTLRVRQGPLRGPGEPEFVDIANGPQIGAKSTASAVTSESPGYQALEAVGATYGVIKLPSDPPHWSDDGE